MSSDDSKFQWDLFISYASEDRNGLVKPLVDTLSEFGLRVWWDQFELKAGDSLTRTIDKGLARSRFGVVIISQAFLQKRWTEYELRGLTARELAGPKVVLPAWFGVEVDDILAYSPPLADKKAIAISSPPVATHILEACVEILEVVNPELLTRLHRRAAYELARRRATKKTVQITELMAAPHRHDTLPRDLVGRIRLIRAALLAVHPLTMDQWLDGFKRDAHPTREVELWERISSACLEIAQYLPLTNEELQSVFRLYLLLSTDMEQDPELPESLEEHRDLLRATFDSNFPVLEIPPPDEDEFGDVASEDLGNVHIENFDDRISPELATRLVERLSNMQASEAPRVD
ncbi:toll/interleukin-1 receptor domain-containing protein [Phytohabitans kaempferiae]|uniref:Toll/interleukin-1 receptor domain-containing protein n=1 Tax=Phytohabitans kaempferiae TaxID=1620943 RepID=A0ABV6MFI4_9ACTN